MRIGVLTGGGDCPGLNQALRAVVMRGMDHGFELVGIKRGWDGLINVDAVPLGLAQVEDLVAGGEHGRASGAGRPRGKPAWIEPHRLSIRGPQGLRLRPCNEWLEVG